MTSRPPDRPLSARLRRLHDGVRRAFVARHALRAFALATAALAVIVVAGAVISGGPGWAAARLALLLAAVGTACAFAVRGLLRELPRFDAWLEAVENRLPELRSWLRNALDLEAAPGAHTSPELAGALRVEATKRLDASPIAADRPALRARTPLLVFAGALAVLVALTLGNPRGALRSWTTLWDPAAAAPPVALSVEPGSVTITPGATLAVRARVRGTASAPRLLGDGAAPPAQLESSADGERHWRFDLPPVTRARAYAVRVQRTESPRYRIALAGEPQPVSFNYELRAPAYARLPVQTGSTTRGDLAALTGSTARVEVTFDRDLESLSATVPGGVTTPWSAITPRRWRGEVRIAHDGEYVLRGQAASGAGTWHYRVSALPDAPPVVTVATPQGDTDLPAGGQIGYDVLVQDDLGLGVLKLQYRKGAGQPWRNVPLPAFRGEPREARVTSEWDASALALLPGEAGTFRFEITDNNRVSGPSRAYSPEFRLTFPSLAELYDNLDQRQERVQQSLQRVAEQAREVQRSLDQLQRTQPRPGMQSAPQFERSEELRKTLERQQQLAQQIDQATQDMRAHMADAAERQAFREELQTKLREMNELMRQIQSPEFKEAMERMKSALEQMDRRAMEQALPQLQKQNKDLMQNLERSLALLKQLRDEERLESLGKRADELQKQQEALNREHDAQAKAQQQAGQKPQQSQQQKALAQKQSEAAQQSRSLADDAKKASEQMNSDAAKQDLQAAAQELEQQASEQQSQASQQEAAGAPQKASKSGEQASESLQRAAQRMRNSSQSAQQQRNERQLAAVRRSSQDLVSLGREAAANAGSSAPQQEQANRQTDLSEGVARVADSLAALGRETPVISPRIQESLGRAMSGLSRSGRELAQGNRSGGQQEGGAARAALNEAVNALRDAEAGMCNKPGQGGPGQSMAKGPGQKMSELGESQGQLNQRSAQLARRLSQQMRLSTGDQAEMRKLADEQSRIRSELEGLQNDEASRRQLLGRLDQTRKEMQEVEEQMRSGRPGADLEERQTKILSRLLDAQRSINRRDFDPEREAQHAQDVAHGSAAQLPGAMLRENDRLRFDLMKADADRYPAQYRALIERYLQRLNGSPR